MSASATSRIASGGVVHKFHAANHGQAAATDAGAGFDRILDSLAAAPDSATDNGDSSDAEDGAHAIAAKDGQAGKSDAETAQATLVLALGAGVPDPSKTGIAKDTGSPGDDDAKGAPQVVQDAGEAPSPVPQSADPQDTDVAAILAQPMVPLADSKGARAAKDDGHDPSPSSAKPAEKARSSSREVQSGGPSSSGKSDDPSLGDPGLAAADSGLGEILAQATTQGEPASSQTAAAPAVQRTESAKPAKAQKEKEHKVKDGDQAKDSTAQQSDAPAAVLLALPPPAAAATAGPVLPPDADAKEKDATVGTVSGVDGSPSKKTMASQDGRTTDAAERPAALAPGKAAIPVPSPNGQTDNSVGTSAGSTGTGTGTGAGAPGKAGASSDDRKATLPGDKPGFAVLQIPVAPQKPASAQDGSLLVQTALPPHGASDGPSVTQHVQVVDGHSANIAALAIAIAAKSQSGNKEFDIRLDPPELGRVDVRLSIDQSGKAQASLSADQPRTLDLLRNDAPQLTRALRDAGLNMAQNGLNFSLRGQDRHNPNSNFSARNGRPSRALKAIGAIGAVKSAPHYQGPAQGRLDIRV